MSSVLHATRSEIQVFLTAVMFYTRIPCPKWVDHSEEYLNQATRYFPLIGGLVGLASGMVFWLSTFLLPSPVGVVLSMICSILMTGALHEDGFADVCDGFGGGWTKAKILTIMKDSVIGAYGVIGMVLILLLKFLLLSELVGSFSVQLVVIVLICAHSISRLGAVLMVYSMKYARENEDSKAKPVAKGISMSSLIAAALFGTAPLFLLDNYWFFLTMVPVVLTKTYLSYYFKKWIGGYTGDCLGATQQTCEIIFYLSLLILWKFI